jgi:hypothetical protein
MKSSDNCFRGLRSRREAWKRDLPLMGFSPVKLIVVLSGFVLSRADGFGDCVRAKGRRAKARDQQGGGAEYGENASIHSRTNLGLLVRDDNSPAAPWFREQAEGNCVHQEWPGPKMLCRIFVTANLLVSSKLT